MLSSLFLDYDWCSLTVLTISHSLTISTTAARALVVSEERWGRGGEAGSEYDSVPVRVSVSLFARVQWPPRTTDGQLEGSRIV